MGKGKKCSKFAAKNKRRTDFAATVGRTPPVPPQQRGTNRNVVTVSSVNVKSESRKVILGMLQKLDIFKNLSAVEENEEEAGEAKNTETPKLSKSELLAQLVAVEKKEQGTGKQSPGKGPVNSPLYIKEAEQKVGSRVRCSVCLPHLLREKKPVVVVSSLDLTSLFTVAKNKLKQLKKPAKAFLVVEENQRDPTSSTYIEIFNSASFRNEAVIAITNGCSFEDAVTSKGKAPPPRPAPKPAQEEKPASGPSLVTEESKGEETDSPEVLLQRVRESYLSRSRRTVTSAPAGPAKPARTPAAIMAQRQRLPAYVNREKILALVRANQVVVLSGETGCGKTTQVPQLLLDDAASRGERCSIVCTQPRRISAIGVASRVASERGEKVGQSVGYSVRVERRMSKDTRIHFCTVGVLLRRIQNDPELSGTTHVLVDEVHERGVQSDFLLIVLRRLCAARPDLRVVLMSASINPALFSAYFGGCPTIAVPGLAFPVETFFLEEAIEHCSYFVRDGDRYARHYKNGKPKPPRQGANLADWDLEAAAAKHPEAAGYPEAKRSQLVRSTLDTVKGDEINFELIEKLVLHCRNQGAQGRGGRAILVFLPGMQDIISLQRVLAGSDLLKPRENFLILPLHSSLNGQEQQRVFLSPPEGVCKVVLATNVAETSITIDDLGFVIDSCRVKENQFDSLNNMPTLVETWVSKASAQQRRGRAGRTGKGVCYHLVQKRHHDLAFAAFTTPEMLRVSLEDLVLQIKLLQLGGPEGCPFRFLSQAIEPPPLAAVRRTLLWLTEINALAKRTKDSPSTGEQAGKNGAICDATKKPQGEASSDASKKPQGEADAEASKKTQEEADAEASKKTQEEAHKAHYAGIEDETILTPLGFNLALLPVDIRLGKLLIFSCIFKCLDPVLSICAAMSFKTPFTSGPPGMQQQANDAKLSFARAVHPPSDLLAIAVVYNRWIQIRDREGHGSRAEWAFAKDNFISLSALRTMHQLRADFTRQLCTAGFINGRAAGYLDAKEVSQLVQRYSANGSVYPLVSCVLVAGLYPHVAYVHTPADSGGGSKLLSKPGEVCHVHPSSVNFQVMPNTWRTRLVMFHERMRTTKVYLRDTTPVTPTMLLLFGGELTIDHLNDTVRVGEWIQVKASTKTAVLFKFLRRSIDEVLVNKIQGAQGTEEKDDLVIETIVTLLGGRA